MRRWRTTSAVLLLLALGGVSARAQSKSWLVCGGNSFATCASVRVSVSGTLVTVFVSNLSGTHSTYGGTIFGGLGLYNVPQSVCVVNSHGLCTVEPVQTVMSGPSRTSNRTATTPWWVQNDKQLGGGIMLDLVARSGPNTPNVNEGIASNCLLNAVPRGSNNFWMNPTCGTTGVTNPTLNGGLVVFSFHVSQGWNPSTTQLLVKGQNGPNGQSTQCFTGPGQNGQSANCFAFTAPEPVSIVLLGSGLLAVGGLGWVRRRRPNDDIGSA